MIASGMKWYWLLAGISSKSAAAAASVRHYGEGYLLCRSTSERGQNQVVARKYLATTARQMPDYQVHCCFIHQPSSTKER